MGIRGLMTYINRNPNFFEPYELHGGYLVIDGHSLAAQLYISSRCNCAFGGDHDRYAHCISEFFDELHKCDVIPLVILDGGAESKKMKTTYTRMADKLQSAINYTPASQSQIKFMPMAMMIIFKSVVRKKGVKLARSVLEADPAIAGVAKMLNCPVLSYDSDFYIFGVMYIPINTLEPFVVKSSSGKGYAKRCKLFRVENLLKTFPGLDPSVLPLAAILLGNDYVKSKIFKNFFDCLKLTNQNQRLYNEGQRRIHTTLRWLKNYNLNDAVAAILSKLPKKRRRKVLDIIELIVDGYLTLPCDMLVPLGLEKEYKEIMIARRQQRKFKFEGNIDTLESRQLWRENNVVASENSSSGEDTDEEKIDLVSEIPSDADESDDFSHTWPPWFQHHHSIADFPAYFVDMIHRRMFTVPVQIEDLKYPSAYSMSLKIVGVTDGLLVAGRSESDVDLSYIIREGTNFVRRRMETVRGTDSTLFPALAELRDTPMSVRKRIIDDTLEISGKEDLIDDIPAEWRLYVATILYWMNQPDEPLRNSRHMHAVLFTMLLGIIDKKIGYHRSLYTFNKTHGKTVAEIETKKKSGKAEATAEKMDSILEALKAVTENDCLLAAPFFISNYTMDQQLCACPRKFNKTIVHTFSQFQSCMRHAVHLNALLGCPYEYPTIADLYNGTMLYNLYTNFKKRADVDAYVSVVLENSPSLLNLLKLLTEKVKEMVNRGMVAIVDESRGRGVKRRKNKKKAKEEASEEKLIAEEVEPMELQSQFVDRQNSFSVLGISG